MKREKLFLLAGCFVISALFGYSSFVAFGPEVLPNDDLLVNRFNNSIEAFERLNNLFKENPRLRLLFRDSFTEEFEPGKRTPAVGTPLLSEDQIAVSGVTLDKIGVHLIDRELLPRGEIIRFVAKTIDFEPGVIDGRYVEKGYVYSEKELSPLVDSLDDEDGSRGIVYRKLSPHWYLYCYMGAHKPE